MSIREVAQYLDVSESTIYQWRYRGEGPRGYRLGNGRVRYKRADIAAWLESQADRPKIATG